MLPARLVLVVMCVCECACGRADASALINEPAIIIYTSCSSSYHPIYSHHSLISFVRSLFVVLDVWCSRLHSSSCSRGLYTPDSSRHFGTPLHSTHLTIKVPPPLSWFCETCTYLPHWRFNKEHLLAYCFRVSVMTNCWWINLFSCLNNTLICFTWIIL